MAPLGDAAHPMYPVGSNGASQAILDARCVASLLAETTDVVTALRAYEAAHLPVTAKIVQDNRAGGPERVIDVVEERAPNGFAHLDEVASRAELEAIVKATQSWRASTRAGKPLNLPHSLAVSQPRWHRVTQSDGPARRLNQPGDLLQAGIHNCRPFARGLSTPTQALQKLLTIGGIFK